MSLPVVRFDPSFSDFSFSPLSAEHLLLLSSFTLWILVSCWASVFFIREYASLSLLCVFSSLPASHRFDVLSLQSLSHSISSSHTQTIGIVRRREGIHVVLFAPFTGWCFVQESSEFCDYSSLNVSSHGFKIIINVKLVPFLFNGSPFTDRTSGAAVLLLLKLEKMLEADLLSRDGERNHISKDSFISIRFRFCLE